MAKPAPPALKVVAAVIRRDDGRILISRRPTHLHQGGLWEFPGGKREPGESRLEALARELGEELGIGVSRGTPLLHLEHAYPDKTVALDIWMIEQWRGEPSGLEAQAIRWVEPDRLGDFAFPAANATIITAARLPRLLLMPSAALVARDNFAETLESCLRCGFSACVLPPCAPATLQACAALAGTYGATIHLADPARGIAPPHGIGRHLSADELRQMAESGKDTSGAPRLSASVASVDDLRRACQIGVEWLVLSGAEGRTLRDLPLALRIALEAEKVPMYKSATLDVDGYADALRDGFQGVVVAEPRLIGKPATLAELFRGSLARAAVVLES